MKVVTFGRSHRNQVTLKNPKISRVHCQIIQQDDGTFRIVDFNSTNGTYVNGTRIYGEAPLSPGDSVSLGSYPLQWQSYFKEANSDDNSSDAVIGVIVIVLLAGVAFFSIRSCGGSTPTPTPTGTVTNTNSGNGNNPSTSVQSNQQGGRGKEMVFCPMCNGTGVFDFMPGDIMAPKSKCSNCNGTGMCTQEAAQNTLRMKQDVDRMIGPSPSLPNDGEYDNIRRNPDGSVRCPICYGSGKCDMCAGRGERRYYSYYTSSNEIMDCSNCRGTGRCQTCYGKGTI